MREETDSRVVRPGEVNAISDPFRDDEESGKQEAEAVVTAAAPMQAFGGEGYLPTSNEDETEKRSNRDRRRSIFAIVMCVLIAVVVLSVGLVVGMGRKDDSPSQFS